MVRVKKEARSAILRKSGTAGAFSRPWYPKQDPGGTAMQMDAQREFCTIPLPLDQDRDSCIRTAMSCGEEAYGIVPAGSGFGLRVRAEKKEETTRNIHSEGAQRFLGEKYEVRGIPLSWGKDEIKTFLGSWNVEPVFSKRTGYCKTWVVRAETAPVASKLQHDFGLAVISLHAGSTRKPAQVQIWKPSKRPSANVRTPGIATTQPLRGAWSSHPAQPRQAAAPKGLLNRAALTQPAGQPAQAPEEIPAAILQAITAAVAAAVVPLKQEIQAMKRASHEDVDDILFAQEEPPYGLDTYGPVEEKSCFREQPY